MEVKLFKLVNNLEIIGELVETTGRGYEVRNPLIGQIVQGEGGKPTLAFYEYTLFTPDNTTVHFMDHMLQCDPLPILPEIAASYEQQHSQIILPPAAAGQILHG